MLIRHEKLALQGAPSLRSYIVAQTLGRGLAAWAARLRKRGRIRFVGCERFLEAASCGRTLILTNHPSLLAETFLLGAFAAPLYLKDPRRALWTMPDVRLLNDWHMPRWLREELHCIQTDRRSTFASSRAAVGALNVLRTGGTIIAHPEGGRTFGAANQDRTPLERNGRVMQDISPSPLLRIAYKAKARILPGWIEVPYAREALSLGACIKRLFTTDDVIEFSFREPSYGLDEPFDLATENRRLQEKIFAA